MKKRRLKNGQGLSENWRKYISDEPDYDGMEILLDDEFEEDIWRIWGPSVLERWLRDRPGSRPSLWWKYEAPRLPAKGTGSFYDGKLEEPRRQVGGSGLTQWEAGENWLPHLKCGIPASRECFKTFDPSDPPNYEAQAVYLKRHGLLTAEEAEALTNRPEAWEPEILKFTERKGDPREC